MSGHISKFKYMYLCASVSLGTLSHFLYLGSLIASSLENLSAHGMVLTRCALIFLICDTLPLWVKRLVRERSEMLLL